MVGVDVCERVAEKVVSYMQLIGLSFHFGVHG
jgi:hypothetical protein